MATGARPSGRARRNSYEDLVDVATGLFSQHGYEGTSVRMIAEALGVQSGSLYSHISSKDEILKRIVLSVASDFLEGARAISASDAPPEERLRSLCRHHLEVLHRHQAAVTVYYDEWRKLEAGPRAEIVEQRREYEQLFGRVVEDGVAAGTFGPVDVRSAVLVLLSACNWTYQWYAPRGRLRPAQIADSYVDLLLSGLLRRP